MSSSPSPQDLETVKSEFIHSLQNCANNDVSSTCSVSSGRPVSVRCCGATCAWLASLFTRCLTLGVFFSGLRAQPTFIPRSATTSTGDESCCCMDYADTLKGLDLTTALDALEDVMADMILNPDDEAVTRMEMERLVSSGALRPLMDMLVDRLHHLISHEPVRPTGTLRTAGAGPLFPDEKLDVSSRLTCGVPRTAAAAGPMFPDEQYVFTIVQRALRTFLEQLMADVLSQLTEDVEECSSVPPVCSPQTAVEGVDLRPQTVVEGVDLRPQTVVEGVDLSLLITMMTREVVNTLSRRPRENSASLPRSLPTDQENLTNYKVMASKEKANATNEISVGEDYVSLVSAVLMQLLTRIEPTTTDMADFPDFYRGLMEQTLTDFCSASGLSRHEACPGVSVQRMCSNIYSELLDVFRNKSMVHGLLVYRQPVLKTVLSQFLVNELLKVRRKGSGAGLLHKLKVNGKLADALKKRLAKGNAKVQPMTTKEQACDEDDGEWVSVESSESSSTGSSPSAMEDSTSDLFSKMKRTLSVALSRSRVSPT